MGVLTGGSTVFCSGMDLKAFAEVGLPKGLHKFYANGSRKPLIAAVEGVALAGGFELALTCDVIVASTTAKFGIPEVKVGLFAAGGGLIRPLIRTVFRSSDAKEGPRAFAAKRDPEWIGT